MIRAALVLALSFAGCGTEEQDIERAQPGARGNVVLYVSNQSFERSTVDIRIEVDGREVVSDDFAVESQHNWVEYRLRLAPGKHVIRAESVEGEAVFERSFPIRGRTWAVVDYWCCDSPQGRRSRSTSRGSPSASPSFRSTIVLPRGYEADAGGSRTAPD